MPPVWEVRVKNQAGTLVQVISNYSHLRLTPTVNAAGSYDLTMAYRDGMEDWFDVDGQIEFWRSNLDAGISPRKEFEGMHVDFERWVDQGGQENFSSHGVGYADHLARRVIDAPSGSSGAAKSGAAETAIKEYVDEQCVNPTDPTRVVTGLSIEADAATGSSWSGGRAYRNLLTVCQEIAETGGGDFSVAGIGAALFEFRWHNGQLGTDRRATVRFGLSYNNMGAPKYMVSRIAERNAILVGGGGLAAERETVWRTDPARIAVSPWGRREEFVDARDVEQGSTAILNTRGDTRLAERRPEIGMSFEILQTPGLLYGRDYFLGDVVTGEFAGQVVVQKIEGFVIEVDRSGERLRGVLRDV